MEKKNIIIYVLTIILTIALGVGIGFGVSKLSQNNNEQEVKDNNENIEETEDKDDKSNSDNSTNNIEERNIEVITAVNYVDEYYKKFYIKLPKITGNSETIVKLNNKILNEILPKTYSNPICHAEMEDGCMDKGSSVDYKYLIKDNIVIIYIYSYVPTGGKLAPQSGNGLLNYNYFYDITNDKMLSLAEATDRLKIKDLDGASSSKDLLDECSWMIVENNDVKINYNEGCV